MGWKKIKQLKWCVCVCVWFINASANRVHTHVHCERTKRLDTSCVCISQQKISAHKEIFFYDVNAASRE